MASVDEEWTPGRGEDFLNLRLELTPPAGGFDDDDDDDSSDEDSIHSDTPTEEAEQEEEEEDVRGGARGGRGHGDACASEDRRVRPSTVEEEKDGLDDDDDDEDLGPDERLTDETAELFRSKTPLDLTRLTASLPSSFDPSAVPASYETLHKHWANGEDPTTEEDHVRRLKSIIIAVEAKDVMECAPRTVSTTAPQCSRNYVEFRLYKARKDLGLFSARVPGWGGDQGGGRDGADLSSIDVSGELKSVEDEEPIPETPLGITAEDPGPRTEDPEEIPEPTLDTVPSSQRAALARVPGWGGDEGGGRDAAMAEGGGGGREGWASWEEDEIPDPESGPGPAAVEIDEDDGGGDACEEIPDFDVEPAARVGEAAAMVVEENQSEEIQDPGPEPEPAAAVAVEETGDAECGAGEETVEDAPEAELLASERVRKVAGKSSEEWRRFLASSAVDASHIIEGGRKRRRNPKYATPPSETGVCIRPRCSKPEDEGLRKENKRLRKENKRLREEIEALRGQLKRAAGNPSAECDDGGNGEAAQFGCGRCRKSPSGCLQCNPAKMAAHERRKSGETPAPRVSKTCAVRVKRERPMPREGALRGLFFLLTGFTSTQSAKICDDVESNGGKVLETLERASEEVKDVVVVAKDNTRTLKVLFALSVGRPVVKRSWVEESVKAGFPVEMKRSLLLWGPRNGEKMFRAGETFVLFGSAKFLSGGFRQVLECGGARVIALAGKGRRSAKFRDARGVIVEDVAALPANHGIPKDVLIIDYKKFTKAMETGMNKLLNR